MLYSPSQYFSCMSCVSRSAIEPVNTLSFYLIYLMTSFLWLWFTKIVNFRIDLEIVSQRYFQTLSAVYKLPVSTRRWRWRLTLTQRCLDVNNVVTTSKQPRVLTGLWLNASLHTTNKCLLILCWPTVITSFHRSQFCAGWSLLLTHYRTSREIYNNFFAYSFRRHLIFYTRDTD